MDEIWKDIKKYLTNFNIQNLVIPKISSKFVSVNQKDKTPRVNVRCPADRNKTG